MSIVRVELIASAAGSIGGVAWHHLFLLATEISGKQNYLRAGPQRLPRESMAGRTGVDGDAFEEYEASPPESHGEIAISQGAYEPGGVDFDPAAEGVTLAQGAAAAALWDKVREAAQALQEEQIPYDPLGRGANWAVMEALRRSGVQAAPPPKRWAPGVAEIRVATAVQAASGRRVGKAIMG
jgi:hypothetical protein